MTKEDETELPPGWTTAKLPDLISAEGVLSDGDWVESKDQDPEGAVRLTQLADIGDGEWRDRSSRFLTPLKALELRCTYLLKGDVLVARMPDPLGRSCVFPGDPLDSVTVVDVCIIRPGHNLISKAWLSYFINAPGFRTAIARLQSGTTRKRISRKNLCTIDLPIPPTREQRRIVEALDSYLTRLDEATATLERVQRNLERYRASVLKSAVEGRLVPTEAELARAEGRNYEPASVLLERILTERRRRWEEAELAKMEAKGKTPKNDKWKAKYREPAGPDTEELPELPEGWCWATIDHVGDVSGGLTQNSKRAALPAKYPYLRVANVYANELRLDEVNEMGVSPADIERAALDKNDLLIVEGNGSLDQIGRVALWDGSIEPCLHQNHLIKVRLFEPSLANWSLYWLLAPSGRRVIEQVASSTSGLHTLSLSKVRQLLIPLAPRNEQVRIAEEIERLVTTTRAVATEVRTTTERITRLHQSILKWAFEGKLVDQDPTDEPASVLLDRIRAEREAAAPKKKTRRKKKKAATK